MKGLDGRLLEDELYALIGDEIESGHKDQAAWTRAQADGAGDPALIKAAYIKHRLRRLQDEIILHARRRAKEVEAVERENQRKATEAARIKSGELSDFFRKQDNEHLLRIQKEEREDERSSFGQRIVRYAVALSVFIAGVVFFFR